jgi:hypothetical protein
MTNQISWGGNRCDKLAVEWHMKARQPKVGRSRDQKQRCSPGRRCSTISAGERTFSSKSPIARRRIPEFAIKLTSKDLTPSKAGILPILPMGSCNRGSLSCRDPCRQRSSVARSDMGRPGDVHQDARSYRVLTHYGVATR